MEVKYAEQRQTCYMWRKIDITNSALNMLALQIAAFDLPKKKIKYTYIF